MTEFELRGRAWRVGDNVPSDHIVASHGILRPMDEIAREVLVQQHPGFAAGVQRGDILVAGAHFGQSSGRQVAAKVLAHVGISCVIADSVARTFWRNAWEIGLPAIECPGVSDLIADGDTVRIRLIDGHVVDESTGREATFSPPDEFILSMLRAGGIVPLAELMRDTWNL